MNVITYPRGVASYMDTLAAGSLGNYRQLLEGVALHPMMGLYLSHLGNRKEDPASGRVPDENYAREVMQLFSIGLDELNADGSARPTRAAGRSRPTATTTISGLAQGLHRLELARAGADRRVLFADYSNPSSCRRRRPERDIRPMRFYPQHHSTSEKRFLGTTIPANTDAPTQPEDRARHELASHPNVGPFIGRQLIQRLVTSNPSPAYVGRVAAAFADNGAGVRGDMKAVVRAILLDPEARADPAPRQHALGQAARADAALHRLGARASTCARPRGAWAYGSTADPVDRASARARCSRPRSSTSSAPATCRRISGRPRRHWSAPEMQITNETTVASYVNFMQSTVGYFGTGFLLDLNTDYAARARARRRPAGAGRPDRPAARRRADVARRRRALMRERDRAIPPATDYRENRARLRGAATLMASARFPGRRSEPRHDDRQRLPAAPSCGAPPRSRSSASPRRSR